MNEKINIEEQANQEVASQENENVNIEELKSTIKALEEKIEKLETELNETKEDKNRYWSYYSNASDKVRLLVAMMKSECGELMTAGQFAERVISHI